MKSTFSLVLYQLRDKKKGAAKENLTCGILNLKCEVSFSLQKHKSLYKLKKKKNKYSCSSNSMSASVEVIHPALKRIHVWES